MTVINANPETGSSDISKGGKCLIAIIMFIVVAVIGYTVSFLSKLDLSSSENNKFITKLESDLSLTTNVGFVSSFEPLYENTNAGLLSESNTRTGTIVETEGGIVVGVSESFDTITSGVQLRKAKYKETIVYCLYKKKISCSFEKHINII